jgi:hypothetical protein
MIFEQRAVRAEMFVKGKLQPWLGSESRRVSRYKVLDRYFDRFLPAAELVGDTGAGVTSGASASVGVVGAVGAVGGKENIFSLWLQGEDQAPPLVTACMRSIRRNCTEQQLVVLDQKSLFDYIDMPGWIMDKYRGGKMRAAHFADVARVELLHNHGGFWLDATCFATAPIPKFIVDEEFFVYRTGHVYTPTFIQNCFIRSRKGAWLLEAWRAMIHEYWRREPDAIDYFMHQLLFKKLVQGDLRAMERFGAMPQVDQDPTHVVWWNYGRQPFDGELFARLTADAFFQKTAYHSSWATNPPSGSFADEMIHRIP